VLPRNRAHTVCRVSGDPEQARRIVKAFMARAERIMSTDAAQREDLATMGSSLQVMVRAGAREQRIWRTHLPETELIHAAAIIRPVILQRELVHLGRVVGAIGFLTRDASDEVQRVVRVLRRSWHPNLYGERWVVMVAHPLEGQATRLTDVDIAELWFNAHVWHDDQDKQWALRYIDTDECLICGTVWMSDRILVVRAVQQLIVDLRQEGHLSA
jgi:hypothetical protein